MLYTGIRLEFKGVALRYDMIRPFTTLPGATLPGAHQSHQIINVHTHTHTHT